MPRQKHCRQKIVKFIAANMKYNIFIDYDRSSSSYDAFNYKLCVHLLNMTENSFARCKQQNMNKLNHAKYGNKNTKKLNYIKVMELNKRNIFF